MDSEENKDENPIDPIDLSIFREHIENNLLTIIDSLPKVEKTLVLDKSTFKKKDFITRPEKLASLKIKKDIITLKPGNLMVDSPIIIYLIPSLKELIQIIEKHIETHYNNMKNKNEEEGQEKGATNKEYHIIFYPKITNECQNYISNSNYQTLLNIHNLNIDIYPLDYDIMSLEENDSLHQLYITENYNSLFLLNRAIIKYETVFGKIKYKYYKGNLAKKLKEMLDEEEKGLKFEDEPKTLACVMFDRTVDMITPLLTNQVYEALIDDNFGIDLNEIEVSSKIIDKESKKETTKIDLSRTDKFYSKIKDYNFIKIKNYLPNLFQKQNKIIDESKKTKNDMKKIQEDLENISKLKASRPSVTINISLADYISKKEKVPITRFYRTYEYGLIFEETPDKIQEFILDEIRKKSDQYEILKIICLYNIINSGFKSKFYDLLRKEFFIVYGFQELFLWKNLEKMGILKLSDSQNYYTILRKKLALVKEDLIDSQEQKDAAYTYNGFCPITIRLLEILESKGWGSIKDILKDVPGGSWDNPSDEKEIISQKEKQFILLVYIGGLTYGELAAIRYLNKKMKNKKFVVLTTNMINTKKVFDGLKKGKYNYIPRDPNDKSNFVMTFKEALNQSIQFKEKAKEKKDKK